MNSLRLNELFVESEPGILRFKTDRYSGIVYSRLMARAGDIAGHLDKRKNYWIMYVDGENVTRGRVIWEMHNGPIPDGMEIDHKNHDTLNDSIDNIRLASRKQNQANRRKHKNNTSGLKGVSYEQSKCKWRAQMQFEGKRKTIGSYENKWLAYAAYCDAVLDYHGEFACL
jgi:hypothetical protein